VRPLHQQLIWRRRKTPYRLKVSKENYLARSSKSSGNQQSFLLWIGAAALILILDQLTKVIAKSSLIEGISQPVTSFLNWTLVYNPGAAFSFLAQAGGWQRWFFTGIGLIAAAVMIWLIKKNTSQTLFCLAMSLVLSGAIGNVIDRILYGAVVDFVDLHYAGWHWPAFNIADSAITIGVILLILDEIKRVNK
jgi:signal peptidase II